MKTTIETKAAKKNNRIGAITIHTDITRGGNVKIPFIEDGMTGGTGTVASAAKAMDKAKSINIIASDPNDFTENGVKSYTGMFDEKLGAYIFTATGYSKNFERKTYSFATAKETILKLAKNEVEGNYIHTNPVEADTDDYAVSEDAFQIAVNAEIEIANVGKKVSEPEIEQAANTVAEIEIDGTDETAFDLLPNFEDDELRDYLYDFDEKQQLLEDKYEPKTPENDGARLTVCIEPAPIDDKNGVIAEIVNKHAPEGWAVIRDNEKLRVEYQGKYVATADKFNTCDVLLPENFFNQFTPLVDKPKTPAQMFLDDRNREIENLTEMRNSPDCTPDDVDADKILAKLEQAANTVAEDDKTEIDADSKIAELVTEYAVAKKNNDECYATLCAAQAAVDNAVNQTDMKLDALNNFGEETADKLREKFLNAVKPYPNIEIKNQDGYATIPYLETTCVYFTGGKGKIAFTFTCEISEGGDFKLGEYSTAKRAGTVIDELKAALERGDKKFTFPADVSKPEPPKPETPERTRIQTDDVRGTWLSQYWPIDTYIHAEDDDGNAIEITKADVDAIEKSLRGKYHVNHNGDGVEFFAEDCTASLLSAICTELEDRGCYIEDYHDAWEEERELEAAAKTSKEEPPIIKYMNANAPEGWSITNDPPKIRVEYKGKFVDNADRITQRDLLAPESFFKQFLPLVDKSKTPAQMAIDDRYREIENLTEMRQSPECTPDTAAKIDAMIEQVKRDIAEAEFGTADTVESFCKSGAVDDDGRIWF